MSTQSRLAYVALYEDRTQTTGELAGWYVGLAREDEAGYYPLRPGYGPYSDQIACQKSVNKMNKKMRLSREDAAFIVASSMRAQFNEARGRRWRE